MEPSRTVVFVEFFFFFSFCVFFLKELHDLNPEFPFANKVGWEKK